VVLATLISLPLVHAGSLAGFEAAIEFTFGSIVQRVMCWPGNVRFHYGHPDVWNKLFVMTRGGMSKATR
jgi:1,3-beta-glucan synthase